MAPVKITGLKSTTYLVTFFRKNKMDEEDYFGQMQSVSELMSVFGLSESEAGKLWTAIKERRSEIFEKMKRRKKQNKNQQQRQPEPQKRKEDWLLELLILLIILRQKQRLSLNHNLIISLAGIVNLIDNANEIQLETKPESKPKL
jgi:hypothetical protein